MKIIKKIEFWALIISVLAFMSSIYVSCEQRELNHQHITPEIFSKIEFPFRVNKYDTTNPEIIIFNNSPLKAISITVDVLDILYDTNKKEVVKYIASKHDPHDHLLFLEELAPGKSERKSIAGTNFSDCIDTFIIDLAYFRPSDMKQYKKRELVFIENKIIYTHKEYLSKPLYKELMKIVDSAEKQIQGASFVSVKAVDDNTWLLEADPEKYTGEPNNNRGFTITNKNP